MDALDFSQYIIPQQPINKNNKKFKKNLEYETPDYFYMLTETDQAEYRDLQILLSSPSNRYSRNKKVETIKESIEKVKVFIHKKDKENDWKRSLVCGLILLNKNKNLNEECISINIRQLKILIGKSKSTINCSLAQMGFVTCPTKGDDQTLLLNTMPYFEGKYFEMRQWTIRKRKSDDDIIFNDPLPPLEMGNIENEDFKIDNLDFLDNNYILDDWKLDNADTNNEPFNFNLDTQYNVFTAMLNQGSNNGNNENNLFANVESIIKMQKQENSIHNLKGLDIQNFIIQNIFQLLIVSPFLQIFIYNFLFTYQYFNQNMVTFI